MRSVDANNIRTERGQPIFDRLVSTVDHLRVFDHAFAFGAAGRNQHGHSRPDVRAGEHASAKPGRADDDHAMWIALDDIRMLDWPAP